MYNIILHSSEKIELEIFKEIEKKTNHKVQIILYWDDSDLLRIKKIFPKVKTINYSELIWKGLDGNFNNINQNYFTPEIKEKLKEYEDIFYYMIDRFDRSKNITFYQRFNLYKFLYYNIAYYYIQTLKHPYCKYK